MQDGNLASLEQIVSTAFLRFEANLRASLPMTAPHVMEWLHGVPSPASPETVLNSPTFPHYVLPYWISPPQAREADLDFHIDLIYSTINGSYFIRLCDNIADNDSPPELRKVAPSAAYFDNQFIRPYMKYFSSTNKFWILFDKLWAQQSESSSADSLCEDINIASFIAISSKKFTAAKIPIAAVCLRYEDLETSIESWFNFIDKLGSFTQFNNDFFDWNHDSIYGITTYVSSEARRRAPGDSLARWFLREGFDWGASVLRSGLDSVKQQAEHLGNRALLDWVIARGTALERDIANTRSALELVKTFGKIVSGKAAKGGVRGTSR
jgi:hypothetical protein